MKFAPVVKPIVPLSATERKIAQWLAESDMTKREIATAHGVAHRALLSGITRASLKLPGILDPMARVRWWARGATIFMLNGQVPLPSGDPSTA